jgi:hypothetical protein
MIATRLPRLLFVELLPRLILASFSRGRLPLL